MDIFNQMPSISEDTLNYKFYLPSEFSSDKNSATSLAACIQAYVDSLLPPEFLWHRDSFELKVAHEDDASEWILEGVMRVGDCVDDEWCTVWLLREITSRWDIAARVFDSDGEFLLIEAADALPSWVKPSNSDYRVWIYRSHLHLIDLSHISPPSRNPNRHKHAGRIDSDDEDDRMNLDEEEEYLVVDDALKLLRDSVTDTRAPPKVEEIVWNRISEYPATFRRHVHFTKAYLPLDIAKALSVNPSLVQKAVEAFYTRDAVQLRAAHKMSRFPPNTCVLTTVKMTRTSYAQLVGQKFYPPKIFGRWEEREDTKAWRWRDIGMKIAVGFEMLFQESKGREIKNSTVDGQKSSAEAEKDALRRNPDYQTYIHNLVSATYFRGETEGSQLWQELENKAVRAFVTARTDDSSARPSFASLVNSAISRASFLSTVEMEEDNDDWLTIDAENFDAMLQQSGPNRTAKIGDSNGMDVDIEGSVAEKQTSNLRDLASKVEEFIEGEGDIEGARFADEMFSDEELEDNENDSDSAHSEDEREQKERRQAAMDNLVSKLDPSEYGQMPASFHSNSQRVTRATTESDMADEFPSGGQDGKLETPRSRRIRQPIIPRDKYEGVDSDDETDEEDDEDPESEEDKPQVVGDIEIDMNEEQEEFLEFSRQALGISDDQWKSILQDRRDRGAFVPKGLGSNQFSAKPDSAPSPKEREQNTRTEKSTSTPNPNLDSFEAVMKAMDAELNRSKTKKDSSFRSTPTSTSAKGKGKAKATTEDEDEDEDDHLDIEAALEAELKAALEKGEDVDEDGLGQSDVDYNLIKNFLESFKSQDGLSGPVGNLLGRLQQDWKPS
ncbi:SGT1-domain-containing protein [Dendrothele bispora CBS 962.96]|uniref:SGT1-domain-containing protein n=1 Tax=Dendrothele bispora (strain CBS 962.96) TaxID=1314807 RepID=A0A4S8MT54_DENBC|nr:SGT1-domain-containing protein [Dendrothele bispora CBS 962.96]